MTVSNSPNPHRTRFGLALLAAGLSAAALAAQQPDLHAPIGVLPSLDPESAAPEDPGIPPRLLDSSNVDRFLRRAQEALARGDYRGAIPVLQDVIEGRTTEAVGNEDPLSGTLADSSQAVFSEDGRLFRPVSRLCREMLAALDAEALTFYRSRYEVAAERALHEALAKHDAPAVERVFERWFVTETATRAMQLAGDLRMDQGAWRAALRNYRLLLEVSTAPDRGEIDRDWLRFKIALCLQMTGDGGAARQELEALAAESGRRSLRLQGQLLPIAALQDHLSGQVDAPDPLRPATVFREPAEALVPLWEHRFADSAPYRPAKGRPDRLSRPFGSESGPSAAPLFDQFAPGGQILLEADRVAFLDHFRLRLAGLPGGRALGASDGAERPPRPAPGQPRVRIAAYDSLTQRPVTDAERIYAVIGPSRRRVDGMDALLERSLHAFGRRDLRPLWSTVEQEPFESVTFLAAPTVAGDRLLIPTLQNGVFGLDCLDARDGSLAYRVPVHSEGTELVRPISPPIAVDNGQAYMLSGAGVLAAVDVATGDLLWARRYERIHPLRKSPRQSRHLEPERPIFGNVRFYREVELEGFAPSDLVIQDGLVIAAPADSDLLLCLDATTGEPVWMLSRRDLQYLIGHDRSHLYFGAGDEVYCIALHSGLRLWKERLPLQHRSSSWRGRGTLAGDMLFLPGNGHLHLLPLRGERRWRSVRLPDFGIGHARLPGAFDLRVQGPWLVLSHAGGLQVFSTDSALRALADACVDPAERAGLQAQLGDLTAAVDTLQSIDFDHLGADRPQVERRLLTLSGELALAMASHGERDASLALLDRCRNLLSDPALKARWRLERIEVFRALGDLDAVAREQAALQEPGEGRSG